MPKKKIEDMDCDELIKYCPLDSPMTGIASNGPTMCEGKYCETAYENYLESDDDTEEDQ